MGLCCKCCIAPGHALFTLTHGGPDAFPQVPFSSAWYVSEKAFGSDSRCQSLPDLCLHLETACSLATPCELQTKKVYNITFQQSVFIANVSENETWGIPFNVTACPPGLCYNRATRTKW